MELTLDREPEDVVGVHFGKLERGARRSPFEGDMFQIVNAVRRRSADSPSRPSARSTTPCV